MSYKSTTDKLNDYRRQIGELRDKMRAAQAAIEPEAVKNYEFRGANGAAVKLSELFGEKDTLFVIHNMGASCRYCTLWADGFNGVFDHLRSRAAFVVSSPDVPERLALPDGLGRRHDVCPGHGLLARGPPCAGRVGIQAGRGQDRACLRLRAVAR